MFVCLHGAAKSVVAVAHFERLAARRGLAVSALALGVEPDAAMAPAALAGPPRRATAAAVRRAARVVSFGCDLGDLVPGDVPVDRRDDVPAVSDDYPQARDAILAPRYRCSKRSLPPAADRRSRPRPSRGSRRGRRSASASPQANGNVLQGRLRRKEEKAD